MYGTAVFGYFRSWSLCQTAAQSNADFRSGTPEALTSTGSLYALAAAERRGTAGEPSAEHRARSADLLKDVEEVDGIDGGRLALPGMGAGFVGARRLRRYGCLVYREEGRALSLLDHRTEHGEATYLVETTVLILVVFDFIRRYVGAEHDVLLSGRCAY